MAKCVHALDHLTEGLAEIANRLLRAAGDFAVTDDAIVGLDLDQDELRRIGIFVRCPTALVVLGGHRMEPHVSNLHGHASPRDSAICSAVEGTIATAQCCCLSVNRHNGQRIDRAGPFAHRCGTADRGTDVDLPPAT